MTSPDDLPDVTAEPDRYRLLVEHAPLCIHEIDRDGRLTSMNGAGLAMLGTDDESSICGMEYLDLVGESKKAEVGEQMRRAFDGHREYFEFHADGVERVFSSCFIPMRDKTGSVDRLMGLTEDVTDRRSSERRLKGLLHALPDLVFVLTADGLVVDTFAGDGDIVIDGVNWHGNRITELLPAPVGAEIADVIRRTVETGEQQQLRYALDFGDGERWYEGRTAPLLEFGKAEEVVWVAIDITSQVQADRERELLQEQLQQSQKLEAVGVFAAGIAHDFNNILQGMSLLVEECRVDRRDDTLDTLQQLCTRAGKLVSEILTVSQNDTKSYEDHDALVVVTECINLVRQTARSAGVSVSQTTALDTAMVHGSATQLHRVLTNLAVNAMQSMTTGGDIDIAVEPASLGSRDARVLEVEPGDYIRFTVTDTGPGIDPDVLSRVFEPYFTTGNRSESTGLGLSVAHGLVRSHGGAITGTSVPGSGTTFCVYLPVAKAASPTPVKVEVEPAPVDSRTLLLVDDEPLVLTTVARLLAREGFRVLQADSGAAAFAMLRDEPAVDLVLTDKTMPGMSGLELARRLHDSTYDVPVVLMTGDLESDSDDAIARVLQKPFNMTDAVALIQDVLTAR